MQLPNAYFKAHNRKHFNLGTEHQSKSMKNPCTPLFECLPQKFLLQLYFPDINTD